MARILARGLERLSSVFGIAGSQVSTNDLDLGGITLVADVVKLAAQGGPSGMGWNGYGIYCLINTHAGASDVQLSTIQLFDGITSDRPPWLDPVPLDVDLWVIDAFVQVANDGSDPANFSAVNIYLVHSPEARIAGATPVSQFRQYIFNSFEMPIPQGAGPWPCFPSNSGWQGPPVRAIRIPTPTGSTTFVMESRAGAAVAATTIQGGVTVLALARGVTPWG